MLYYSNGTDNNEIRDLIPYLCYFVVSTSVFALLFRTRGVTSPVL